MNTEEDPAPEGQCALTITFGGRDGLAWDLHSKAIDSIKGMLQAIADEMYPGCHYKMELDSLPSKAGSFELDFLIGLIGNLFCFASDYLPHVQMIAGTLIDCLNLKQKIIEFLGGKPPKTIVRDEKGMRIKSANGAEITISNESMKYLKNPVVAGCINKICMLLFSTTDQRDYVDMRSDVKRHRTYKNNTRQWQSLCFYKKRLELAKRS